MGTHRRGRTPRESEPTDNPDNPEAPSPTSLPSPLVDLAPTASIRAIFRRFWPDTRGFRRRMALSLLLVAVPPGLAAAGIWLFKILVDDVLTARNVSLFPMVAAAFVAITVLEGVVGFFDEYLNAWVAERFVLNLRGRIFGHLQRLSLTFFEKRQTGDLLARLTGDVAAIEQLMLSGLNQALTYIFQILFFGGALFILNWRLALAALAGAPILLLLGRFFARRIKAASRERRRRSGSISAVAEESLNNTALVQSYDRAGMESARFHRENLGSFTAQMLATKLEALFSPFTDLLEAAGALLVIALGLRELIAGRITLGGLLVFIGYLTQLYGPITGFGDLANTVFAASAGAERIIEVLDAEPDVLDPADPVPLGRARGAVQVHRLGFRYPDSARPALAEVSFTVGPGETVAVVGASGAGKSTLLHLLLRLYDPGAGAVTLDGVDLRRMRLSTLRRNLAVVLQQTLVFDGTVAENIRWGKPDATPAEVVAAARAADAHQFITGLPGGYHARIGQRGMMLSGGQLQRIALARAMIRNAPVLLLDEPTTGLDAVSTQRVLDPLRRAMDGRTTIVISHNLLTVADADRIVYLDRGRVRGYGTHPELMAGCPGYARLYRLHHPDAAAPAPSNPRARPSHPHRAPAVHANLAVRPTPYPRPKPKPKPGPGPGPARTPAPVPATRTPTPRPRTAKPAPIAISGPHPLPETIRPPIPAPPEPAPGPPPLPETIRLAITEPPMSPKHARTPSSGALSLPNPARRAGSGAHARSERIRNTTSGPHPLPEPTPHTASVPRSLPEPTWAASSATHSPRDSIRTANSGAPETPRPEPLFPAVHARPTPTPRPRSEPATTAIPAQSSPRPTPIPLTPFEPETRPVPSQPPTAEARPSPYPRPRPPSEPMPLRNDPDWLFSAEPGA